MSPCRLVLKWSIYLIYTHDGNSCHRFSLLGHTGGLFIHVCSGTWQYLIKHQHYYWVVSEATLNDKLCALYMLHCSLFTIVNQRDYSSPQLIHALWFFSLCPTWVMRNVLACVCSRPVFPGGGRTRPACVNACYFISWPIRSCLLFPSVTALVCFHIG